MQEHAESLEEQLAASRGAVERVAALTDQLAAAEEARGNLQAGLDAARAEVSRGERAVV